MTTLRSQVARSSAWSLLGQGLQLAFGLASFWLLSHWVGPADYGLVGMASAVTAVLAVVADSGVVAALIRTEHVTDEVEATALWISLGGAAALSLVAAATAPLLGWYFRDERVTWLSLALAAAFLLAAPSRVPTAALTRAFRFRDLTLVTFVSNVAASAVAIGLAYTGAGPWAIVAQTLLAFAIQSAVLTALSPHPASPRLANRSSARALVAFSWRMSGFSICTVAAQMGQTVLGGRLIGPEAPGLVGMAGRLLANPVQRVVGALSSVLLPTLVKLKPSERAHAFTRAVRIALLAVAPLCATVATLAPELVTLLPQRWAGLAGTIRAVAVGLTLEPIGWFSIAVLTAEGRASALLRFGSVFVLLGWVGALGGSLGGTPAALAWGGSLVNLLGGLLLLRMVRSALELRKGFWRSVAHPIFAATLAAAAARLGVMESGTGATCAGVAVGAASAAAIYSAYLLLGFSTDVRWVIATLRSSTEPGVTRPRSVGWEP